MVSYIVGGFGAGYTNQMGLLVNGVQQGGFHLQNHGSNFGDSFNFGHVNAGDSLIFILHNLSLGKDAYSDPSLNVPYDAPNETRHNHIYSTDWNGGPGQQNLNPVPFGAYVAFEDLQFPGADFNYNDESFVFTNVAIQGETVPEPATMTMLGFGIAGLLGYGWRRRKQAASAVS